MVILWTFFTHLINISVFSYAEENDYEPDYSATVEKEDSDSDSNEINDSDSINETKDHFGGNGGYGGGREDFVDSLILLTQVLCRLTLKGCRKIGKILKKKPSNLPQLDGAM